jgi:hypothetical protein
MSFHVDQAAELLAAAAIPNLDRHTVSPTFCSGGGGK